MGQLKKHLCKDNYHDGEKRKPAGRDRGRATPWPLCAMGTIIKIPAP
jgi:hypothetical protein